MSTDLDTINMLRDSLARYASDTYSLTQRLQVLPQPGGFSRKVWADLAENGFLALCLSEEQGGLQGDSHAVAAVMELAGQYLLQEPLLPTVVLAGSALAASTVDAASGLAERLAAGDLVVAAALTPEHGNWAWEDDGITGELQGVVYADQASHLLLAEDDQCVLVELTSTAVQRQAYRLIDSRGAANLQLRAAPAIRLGNRVCRQQLLQQAALASCAEATGAISALLKQTNDYLKVRQQFGRPLASNQALQHRMADMFMLEQEAIALSRAAREVYAGGEPEATEWVHGAKAYVGKALRQVANEAVQLHGGLGITEELEISHYFRRAMVINASYGSRTAHLQAFIDHRLAVTA